jgi:hypothetical protein
MRDDGVGAWLRFVSPFISGGGAYAVGGWDLLVTITLALTGAALALCGYDRYNQ